MDLRILFPLMRFLPKAPLPGLALPLEEILCALPNSVLKAGKTAFAN